MVTRAKPHSPNKAAVLDCNELETPQLLTMLRAYIDPARKESKMVGAIFKTLEGRIAKENKEGKL